MSGVKRAAVFSFLLFVLYALLTIGTYIETRSVCATALWVVWGPLAAIYASTGERIGAIEERFDALGRWMMLVNERVRPRIRETLGDEDNA